MTVPLPRLHREFYNLRVRIENILRNKAKIADDVFQPVLEFAVERYICEKAEPFQFYLLDEIQKTPSLYQLIPSDILKELTAL